MGDNRIVDVKTRIRLAELKKIVKVNLSGAVQFHAALIELHETKLYLIECKAWDEFCVKNFGWELNEARNRWRAAKLWSAHKLIADTTEEPKRKPNPAPSQNKDGSGSDANSEQNEDKQNESSRHAATAPTAKPKPVEDEAGYQIPKEAMQFWERRQEIQDVLTAISRVKSTLEHARAKDDPLFRPISQACTDHLSRAYQYVTDAKPFAVCLQCQGRNVEKCGLCKGTGLIKEETYLTKNLEANRRIREKSYHLQPAL